MQAQNRQGEVKNSIGNGEAKELIYTTSGHELSGGGECSRGQGTGTGDKGDNKIETTVNFFLKEKNKMLTSENRKE